MTELQQALNIVNGIADDPNGKHSFALRLAMRKVSCLLQTAMDKYFLDESEVAILSPDDPLADEVMELTENPFPAA